MEGKGAIVMRMVFGRKVPVFCLLFALLLGLCPVRASEEEAEEVFDPEPWESVEALASLEDVAAHVGAAVLMERETGKSLYEHNPTPGWPPPASPRS